MKLNLRAKLTISFALLITIPVGVLGFLTYQNASKSLQAATEQVVTAMLQQTSEGVESELEIVRSELRTLALDPDILQAVMDPGGNTDKIKQHISAVTSKDERMDSIAITDAHGRVVMDSEAAAVGDEWGDREYIQEALKGWEAVHDRLNANLSEKPSVELSQPLQVGDKIVGVITAVIDFKYLYRHVSEVKIGKEGYAYLMDKQGLMIYHPDASMMLNTKVTDIQSKELNSLAAKALKGEATDGFYTYNGTYKYARFQPLYDWVIVITANYTDYMAAALAIRMEVIVTGVIAVVLAILLGYLFTSTSIIRPLQQLEKLMKKAGSGDLQVHASIRTGDEMQVLGETFNQMISGQVNIIMRVREGAHELAAASEEMAASSEQISSATDQIGASISHVAEDTQKQNHAVLEASQVLVQLSSLVQLAQNKALAASTNAKSSMETAALGRQKVQGTVDAMNHIEQCAEETAQNLQVLNQLSKQIHNITGTINSIASQTNLLALNAAIEAARAGEYGKGFSVVADEVRKLSEQSNVEANAIEKLVREMGLQVERAVESMSRSKEAVVQGVHIAGDTDHSFIGILGAVEGITNSIGEIVDITQDEVATSDQVIKLIDTIASVTEQTSANGEEVSASAEEQMAGIESLAATSEQVSAMASSLDVLVGRFKV